MQQVEQQGAGSDGVIGSKKRLPAFKTAIRACEFLYQWRGDLFRLLWPFLLFEFVGIWGYFLGQTPVAGETSRTLGTIFMVVAIVTVIPIAARVQRFSLSPEPVQNWVHWPFGRDEFLIIRAFLTQIVPMILSFLFFGIIIMIIATPTQNWTSPPVYFLSFLIAISISIFLSRLLIIYPATLDSGRPQLRGAWALTRGNYIRLLILWGVATVPFRLVFRLAGLMDNYIWSGSDSYNLAQVLVYFPAVLIPATLASIGQIIATFVTITIAYQWLTENSPSSAEA